MLNFNIMKQPIKKEIKQEYNLKDIKHRANKSKKKDHPDYNVSKLEDRFAEIFLDKLKVKYVRQFEAKDIGRFYDFYLPDSNLIIEVDGDYFHSNPLIYEGKELTPTQKRNKSVDKMKDRWANLHSIPMLRIWETDINKHPEKVIKMLKDRLHIIDEKQKLLERKKQRH